MFKRLNITLPDDVLARADEFSRRERYTRSGLIAKALDAFVSGVAVESGVAEGGASLAAEASAVYGATAELECLPDAAHQAESTALSLERIGPLVRAYFEGRGDVEAAWVFGSVAHGTAGPMSDVDVAVLPKPELDSDAVWGMRLDAMSHLPRILGVREVDVVSLPDASPVLGHRIVVGGTRVYDAPFGRAAVMEIAAVNAYMDVAPVVKMLDRRLTARLAVRHEG